ncbi:Magnesium transporter protein 1 [Cytospora mali]|uniref:Magnesium transporter protein 1 n=1 Tax=Cytospora mali TaxID=578113 RepID=A0A194WCY4_CYTMA|nr:Magnesium transporter protein 1 [Valsa mali]
MRWSSILLPFTLLGAGVLGAKKADTSDLYQEYQTKAVSGNPVKLDDASYKQITSLPRDYTVAVLLTALDSRFACQICREFDPEWKLLSKSWAKGDKAGESRLILSVLDFNEGRDTFMSLGLQTAPVLLLFQPSTGEFAVPNVDPLRFDFTTGGPSAESVRNWIARHLPGRPHPEINRPTNYFAWITAGVGFLGLVSLWNIVWPVVGPWVMNRKCWAILSLITILTCICGTMFNRIRNVPYAGQDGRGHVSFIAAGFQSQYQIESQIVAFMYAVLSFCAIGLADRAPRVGSAKLQKALIFVYAGVMFAMYSFLLSIFRVKNGGYPFALPPFL